MADSAVIERIDNLRTIGRPSDAEQLIRTALAAEPADAQLLWRLAAVLLTQKRYAEGLAAADGAVAADPENSNAHRLRALLLVEHGEFEQAVHAAYAAVCVAPEHSSNAVVYAYALECAHRYHEAMTVARHAVELAPHDTETHLRVAESAKGLGDVATARAAYHEMLRLDPEHATASRLLALLDSHRRPGRALKWLVTAGRLSPNLPGLLGSVAVVLWRIGLRMRLWLNLAVLAVLILGDEPGDRGTTASTWGARAGAVAVLVLAGLTLWRSARHLPDGARPVLTAALRSDSALLLLWFSIGACLAVYLCVAVSGIAVYVALTWVVSLAFSVVGGFGLRLVRFARRSVARPTSAEGP